MKKSAMIFGLLLFLAIPFSAHAVPVTCYSFSGNAEDECGDSDGSVNGATLTDDRFGNPDSAYSFDGVDDYISTDPVSILGGSTEMTLSLWFNITSSSLHASTLIDQYKGQNGERIFSFETENFGQRLTFIVYGGADTRLRADSSDLGMTTNTWFHAVGRYDNGEIDIFLNGNEIPDSDLSIQQDGTMTTINSMEEIIGMGTNLQTQNWDFNGLLDDIAIYDYALSDTEIQDLYNAPNPVPEPTTFFLLGLGLIGLIGIRKWRG